MGNGQPQLETGKRVPTPETAAGAPRPAHSAERPGRLAGQRRSLSILMTADVDPVAVIGGAERVLNEHSRRLAARGHRVTVLVRRENPELPPHEVLEGVQVYRHEMRTRGQFHFFTSVLREGARAYRRLAAQERFDVINVHQPLAGCAVLRSAGRDHPPLIYTFLSPWAQEYVIRSRRSGVPCRSRGLALGEIPHTVCRTAQAAIRARLEHSVLERSRRVLVLSRFSTHQLQELHGLSAEAVEIVPGGVDTERFHPVSDRSAVRRKLGLPPDAPLLLTVRNLQPRMGLENLVEAMSRVHQAHPRARLVIGGTGPLLSALRLQVQALGLEEVVSFAGFIPEALLPEYYAAADLFVLPTRCLEGFGMVITEALACGTPVLGTPVGAIPEVLGPLDEALLFPSARPEDMVETLVRQIPAVIHDTSLRERCRLHVLTHHAWDVIIDRVEELFLETAKAPAAAGLSQGAPTGNRAIGEAEAA